jgi:precorrin-2 dehydrogenase/sirohydrochlorin ferrochelatase
MSAYPLMLEGTAIDAVVVGGGSVAIRKVRALLDSGARVHVVAPSIDDELEMLAQGDELLRVTRASYEPRQLAGATLVVAATSDAALNASIAREARERGVLVNVVDAPELGTCTTAATFRKGDIVIAVSTGRVPNAAARIRDAITADIDERYSSAVHALSLLRRGLLADGRRDRWREASKALIGDDFCERVEAGGLTERIGEWR